MTDGTTRVSDLHHVGRPGRDASESARVPARRPATSLLADELTGRAALETREDRSFVSDLNLDQIVGKIAGVREEHAFIASLLYQQLDDADTVRYRHEVFRDLEDGRLVEQLQQFADVMWQVRSHLDQIHKMQYQPQREGWFLDAASMYCDAIQSFAEALRSAPLSSRGLRAVRAFLVTYVASADFDSLVADTAARKDALAQIRYCTRIRGLRVDVSRYEDQPDYSAEVLHTFERFKQGAAKDYRVQLPRLAGNEPRGGSDPSVGRASLP